MKKLIAYKVLLGLSILLVVSSCKKYDDPPPYFEEEPENPVQKSRRVLFIGIDGAVGSLVKAIAPANIEGLKAKAKYSYDAVSDEVTTDGTSWKTLMSGVAYSKHQVKDSTFLYTQSSASNPHTTYANYPSIFQFIISSVKPDLRTSFISPWGKMVTTLVPEVQEPVTVANDAVAKDSAIAKIKATRSEFIVVNFNSVSAAGVLHGFSAQSQGYVNALKTVDGYIGEMMTALKARPEYNKNEEWLVIVTGTHGGTGNSYGGGTVAESNIFQIYYNEKFKPLEFTREGAFTGLKFSGRDAGAIKAVSADASKYNPGTGEYTVQLKIKGPNGGNYPHFITKRTGTAFGDPGWSIFTNSSGIWCLSLKSAPSSEKRMQQSAGAVLDNKWHTISFSIFDSAGAKYVKRFTDDKRIVEAATGTQASLMGTNYGDISSPGPLFLGWGGDKTYNAVTFEIADFAIYNKGFTDQEILQGLCLTDITKHPRYANLISYWPGKDAFGGRFNNYAPGNTDPLVLEGPYKWGAITEMPCNVVPINTPTKQSMFLKNVDVATTVFYWLKIAVNDNWKLDGTRWLEAFEQEFVEL